MKYRYNYHYPRRFKKMGIHKHIAEKCLKKIPNDRAGKDLKWRMKDIWASYSYYLIFDDKEMWLEVRYSWAGHSYSLSGAAEKRFRTLVGLVDSW